MKYKILGFFLVASSLLLVSCEKELTQFDPQSFSDANAFKTIEHVEAGVYGAYGSYGSIISDIYKNALTSDEAKMGPDNGGSGLITYRLQYGADGTSGSDVVSGYYGYYSMIDQCNRVLPNVYSVTGGGIDRKNYLKGALLGLRGMAHFGLLQSFCKRYDPNGMGVAIMTAFDNAAKPTRKTMGEVIAQIETDLADAKALVPASSSADFSDTVLNKINIAAFQARVALYKRDYQKALEYSNEVINSGVRPLSDALGGVGSDYDGMWQDATNGEVLFRYRLASSTALGGRWTTAAGAILISPSNKLVASYGSNDARKDIFIGTSPAGFNYLNKHYVSDRGPRMVDAKCIRTSEMYLIRAEAKANLGDITGGASDLNELRRSRIIGYVNQSFGSNTELINAVMQERYKELCFEGFRFYDLKRNGLPMQRDASDAGPEWIGLSSDDYRFVYPIPRDAILANPNTIQNPGY